MAYDEDSRLARKVQKGDRAAFDEILVKYERPIFSFIYNFFRDRALCEDITQETFLRAFRFIDSFHPNKKFSTWLFSIAKNLCIDEFRRAAKAATTDIDSVPPENLVSDEHAGENPMRASIRSQEGEILRRLLLRLPDKYRACLILLYFNELSYEAISEVMGISLSNTKILLFRGKKMLLDLYRKETGETP